MSLKRMVQLRKTLYYRLSSTFLLVLISLGISQIFIFSVLSRRLADQQEQVINWRLASLLKPEVEQRLAANESYYAIAEIFYRQFKTDSRLDYYLLDDAGKVLANLSTYGSQVPINQVALEPIKEFLSGSPHSSAPIYGTYPWRKDKSAVFSVAPIDLAASRGYLYVILRNYRSEVAYSYFGQNTALVFSAGALLLCIIIVGAIGIYSFALLTRRFRRLTEIVQEFRAGNFRRRVNVENDDDIAALSHAVNSMADKIVDSMQELELRDKTRRDLIAGVSHDLRGPVNSMSGFVAELQGQNGQLTAGRLEEIGKVLQRNTGSLKLLLDELFELAKLEAKEKSLECGPLAINDLLRDLEQRFAPRADALELALVFECDDSLPEVFADAGLIERVLWNLIDNALRYTPAGGAVTVSCRGDSEAVQASKVWIEVHDTGFGIPQEQLPYIFDQFHSVRSAKPREGISSGLGLALVKRIVEAHGAKITVASTMGKGSIFRFYLPTVDFEESAVEDSGAG